MTCLEQPNAVLVGGESGAGTSTRGGTAPLPGSSSQVRPGLPGSNSSSGMVRHMTERQQLALGDEEADEAERQGRLRLLTHALARMLCAQIPSQQLLTSTILSDLCRLSMQVLAAPAAGALWHVTVHLPVCMHALCKHDQAHAACLCVCSANSS